MKIKYVKTHKEVQREIGMSIGVWIFIIFCVLVILNKMIEWASLNPYLHP